MARLIQEKLKRPLADQILFGELNGGGEVLVDVKDDDLVLVDEINVKHETSVDVTFRKVSAFFYLTIIDSTLVRSYGVISTLTFSPVEFECNFTHFHKYDDNW